jgi:copper chaperone NosL
MWLRVVKLLSVSAVSLMIACSGPGTSGPVPIYPEDRCVACGMHILDTRYASEVILSNGEVLKFDDIGEMFLYLRSKKVAPEDVRALYVQDFRSRQWLSAKEAIYVVSREIQTPMGTGVIAFANRDEAERTAQGLHGQVASFQDMMSGD